MHDIDGFIFDVKNVVILLRKYTGKTRITQGNHRENTGNFAFRDEWEPCMQVACLNESKIMKVHR